jgi:hypothetical protein
MVDKLHKSWPGGHVCMLVEVDKFTKWVEVAPDPSNHTRFHGSNQLHQVDNILLWVPHSIITDNRMNFPSKEFKIIAKAWGSN